MIKDWFFILKSKFYKWIQKKGKFFKFYCKIINRNIIIGFCNSD